MSWKTELGEKIRKARELADMSQEELSAEISAKFSYKYTRARISQIENGISAPAVNIVTAIAEILNAEFEIGGCKIGKRSELVVGRLSVMAQQLCLEFDVEHSFSAASLKLTSLPENSISLQAVFTRGQFKPIQTIDAGGEKRASA
jgi:transcriptional regulator with XRE-family HTH domain